MPPRRQADCVHYVPLLLFSRATELLKGHRVARKEEGYPNKWRRLCLATRSLQLKQIHRRCSCKIDGRPGLCCLVRPIIQSELVADPA